MVLRYLSEAVLKHAALQYMAFRKDRCRGKEDEVVLESGRMARAPPSSAGR